MVKQQPTPYSYHLINQGFDYQQTNRPIEALLHQKEMGILKNSGLLLFAFATAFFPRLLDEVGAPSVINYIHLIVVPVICLYVIITARAKDKDQLTLIKKLSFGLVGLLTIGFTSALLNQAGFINVVFDFLMSAEAFIFLLAWVCVPLDKDSLRLTLRWFFIFNIFNLILALIQGPTIAFGDYMQGVFYFSGSGHVVSSSVISTYALFYFFSNRRSLPILPIIIILAAFLHLVLSDAKQVILVFIGAFLMLALVNMKDVIKAVLILLFGIAFVYIFYWAIYEFPILGAFRTWIRPEIYMPDGEATLLKTASIRIILDHYQSPLNWFFGLGPGHTVDRLGFTILREHSYILEPLGATISDISLEVQAAREASWLGNQSSFFSPFWGWAGIWGNLGLLGLGTYLYICSVIWRYICSSDFLKFTLLTVMLHGFIFTQMEEPGYMLFIAMMLGLQWHIDQQSKTLYK